MFYSVAKWTKIEDTKDQHETRAQADGIAWRLLNDYGPQTNGCSIRGQCKEAWVEDEKGNKLERHAPIFP